MWLLWWWRRYILFIMLSHEVLEDTLGLRVSVIIISFYSFTHSFTYHICIDYQLNVRLHSIFCRCNKEWKKYLWGKKCKQMTQSIKNVGSVLVSSVSFDLKDFLSPATTGGLPSFYGILYFQVFHFLFHGASLPVLHSQLPLMSSHN